MNRQILLFLALFAFLLTAPASALAWDDWGGPVDEPDSEGDDRPDEEGAGNEEEDDEEEGDEEGDDEEGDDEEEDGDDAEDRELQEYRADGRRVYLICIYGPRDDGTVRRKCAQIEAELNRAYGARWVTRLNNPSEDRLQRIHDRLGHDIGAVIVVTHSTPDPADDSGYDVWDCELDPSDFADIFDEQWVIWNGCFSRGICELNDNILPTQCVDGVLREGDDTWREAVRCLEQTGEAPHDRAAICRRVFGDDWREDED